MKEPSARTSEIREIRVHKKDIELVLDSFSVRISASAYSDGFYYPGRKLDASEIRALKQAGRLFKAENYLARTLSAHRLTKKQCLDRLSRLLLSPADMERLLVPYVESHVLDDRAYCMDFIQDRIEKGYGPKRILAELKKRGIPEVLLEDEETKAMLFDIEIPERLLMTLSNKYKDKTTSIKKEKMLEGLLRRGFPGSSAHEAVEAYLSEHREDPKKEMEKRASLLRKEAEKCYNLLVKRKADPQKKKDAFQSRLRRLGFTWEEIGRIQEERHYTFK